MNVSSNEIESTVYKAVRGAGRAWGEAEEAAAAARWLAARNLPWADSLLDLLARPRERVDPSVASLGGQVAGSPICPLSVGLFVSDVLGPGKTLSLGPIDWPVWVLPFAARLAVHECFVAVTSEGEVAVLRDGSVCLSSGFVQTVRANLKISVGVGVPTPASGFAEAQVWNGPTEIEARAWRDLDRLCVRTYVAASLRSRVSGAGAGLRDDN
jgi:hypothetical protein